MKAAKQVPRGARRCDFMCRRTALLRGAGAGHFDFLRKEHAMQKTINRREFLRGAGAASAMLLTPPFALLPSATRTAHAGAHSGPAPDAEIFLTATKGEAPVLSGRSTAVWTYRGKVLKGEAGSVQPISGSYLGPIIRVRTGGRGSMPVAHAPRTN